MKKNFLALILISIFLGSYACAKKNDNKKKSGEILNIKIKIHNAASDKKRQLPSKQDFVRLLNLNKKNDNIKFLVKTINRSNRIEFRNRFFESINKFCSEKNCINLLPEFVKINDKTLKSKLYGMAVEKIISINNLDYVLKNKSFIKSFIKNSVALDNKNLRSATFLALQLGFYNELKSLIFNNKSNVKSDSDLFLHKCLYYLVTEQIDNSLICTSKGKSDAFKLTEIFSYYVKNKNIKKYEKTFLSLYNKFMNNRASGLWKIVVSMKILFMNTVNTKDLSREDIKEIGEDYVRGFALINLNKKNSKMYLTKDQEQNLMQVYMSKFKGQVLARAINSPKERELLVKHFGKNVMITQSYLVKGE